MKQFTKFQRYGKGKGSVKSSFNVSIDKLSNFEKSWAEYAIKYDELQYTITSEITRFVRLKCISE